jgi:hypothetical protein
MILPFIFRDSYECVGLTFAETLKYEFVRKSLGLALRSECPCLFLDKYQRTIYTYFIPHF